MVFFISCKAKFLIRIFLRVIYKLDCKNHNKRCKNISVEDLNFFSKFGDVHIFGEIENHTLDEYEKSMINFLDFSKPITHGITEC